MKIQSLASYFLLCAFIFISCENYDASSVIPASSNNNSIQVQTTISCQQTIAAQSTFTWSGLTWIIKDGGSSKVGPGPNYFSSSAQNVFVDANGDLHLKITHSKGKYYCAEVYTAAPVGYGSYTFYVSSRVDNLDKNAVVGLFTWNDNDCVTNANSEIDVEFARWGNARNTNVLQYSVQPTNGGTIAGRFATYKFIQTTNYSTHFFNWTPSLVSFASYSGIATPPPLSNQVFNWSFDINHPAVSTNTCSSTPTPIIIPSPETDTRIHLNLWLFQGRSPLSTVELVVHHVDFVPAL